MPSATRSSPKRRRALAARQSQAAQATPIFSPPPFPPFQTLSTTNGVAPFPLDPEDPNNPSGADGLPPGIIAAIVVSVFAFFLLITGFFAFLSYRRRKARGEEIAMKEEATSSAGTPSVTLSGALDPPPPYDEVHHTVIAHTERERRWDSSGGHDTGSEVGMEEQEEEDEETMGSHATITDGLDPGRHSDRG